MTFASDTRSANNPVLVIPSVAVSTAFAASVELNDVETAWDRRKNGEEQRSALQKSRTGILA